MSELFMECVEEELEPWQKQIPQINLIDDDDDDDEPIFVGVISNKKKDGKPSPAPPKTTTTANEEVKCPPPQTALGPSPIVLPLSVPANAMNTTPLTLTTMTPQPVIVNNQGFIVTTPHLTKNNEFIAALGSQYPPGTSFTLVPAGSQPIFQQISSASALQGVVHRPQVQQIRNNVVTLSNVQNPTTYTTQPDQQLPKLPNIVQPTPVAMLSNKNLNDPSSVKRVMATPEVDIVKKTKIDPGPTNLIVRVENGLIKKSCPMCHEDIPTEEAQKNHMLRCRGNVAKAIPPASKLIMLVSDFYYGHFEGDLYKMEAQKTNNTFKCQSCLKVLKNNIRFMNHMKHHLELEKQNSESWESHTTCQHCYRQYMTPFQLQCHIESAHSPIESSTNCKICELAFESEQVLLEHMKVNHKPGEMPYVCQVCNYRSSFFSDLETHFRTVHENTKDLLCPFCLKVLRTSHIFMQHYMKHQKKGIHRCGRCRLNFLTYKEKLEHRNQVHKTFRKPKALEGLPPGTKVTIRASLTGKGNVPVMPLSPDGSPFVSGPESGFSSFSIKPNNDKFKLNNKPQKVRMIQNKNKPEQNKKQERQSYKHNLELKRLSVTGRHTCIECNSVVDNLYLHFPMLSSCGACRYRTSCKTSIGNHMIKYHSTFKKRRFMKVDHKINAPSLKLTLVCLNCDLTVDASGGDQMTKHLTDKPNHICKIINERDIKAESKDLFPEKQPVVRQFLAATWAKELKEMESGNGASVTPEDATDRIVDQPKVEPEEPTEDQKRVSLEISHTDKNTEQKLNPVLSAVCISDGILSECGDPVDHS